jgi:type IV pilus assembly protein PilN
LTAIKQAGDQMVLSGVAQSNASVAQYMRNIEASPWMGSTDLSKTENSHDATRMPYSFGLTVSLQRPKQDDGSGLGASPAASSSAGSLMNSPISPIAPPANQTVPATNPPTPNPSGTPVKGGAKS